MSEEGSGSESPLPKGDPNPQRLLERVMDKLDGVLFANGFEFRDEMDWADACGEVQALILKYWDDLTGGDSDYDPSKPAGSTGSEVEEEVDEVDEEESVTCSLGSSEEEAPRKKLKQ